MPSFVRAIVLTIPLGLAALVASPISGNTTKPVRLDPDTPHHFRRYTGTDSVLLQFLPDKTYRFINRTHNRVDEGDRGYWEQLEQGDLILTSTQYHRNIESPPFTITHITTGTLDDLTTLGIVLKDLLDPTTATQYLDKRGTRKAVEPQQLIDGAAETTITANLYAWVMARHPARPVLKAAVDPARLYRGMEDTKVVTRPEIRQLLDVMDQVKADPPPAGVRLTPRKSNELVWLEMQPTRELPWGGMAISHGPTEIERARDKTCPWNIFAQMSAADFDRESVTTLEYLFDPGQPGGLTPLKSTLGEHTSDTISADPAVDPLRFLAELVPGTRALETSTPAEVAGYYSNPGPTMDMPGLSGNMLYLFPDGSYLYLEWADIMPRTIKGRGKWNLENGYVTLVDDGTLSNSRDLKFRDSLFLPFEITHETTQTAVLLGVPKRYERLASTVKNSGSPPSFMFLIHSLERVHPLPAAESAEVKATLMRKHWRPDFVAGKSGAEFPDW